MNKVKLAGGVYWVGALDWDVRKFHGLSTPQGSTYNSYLIVDEKIALIDAVHASQSEVAIKHITAIVDPLKIDYVISNHSEPDHTGNLPAIMKAAPRAKLLATKDGVKRLQHIYRSQWNFQAVADGEELSLGKRTLKFIYAPLLHWPETMFTYDAADKILFSCDAFGAHVATTERFADELGCSFVLPYTRKYYGFLVSAYRKAVIQALNKIKGLDIEIIAPSHGPIWRGEDINILLKSYLSWANLELEDKAVIIYGSMWQGTRRMAYAIAEGLRDGGLKARVYNVEETEPSDIVADSFIARLILIGSPTFESGIYPPVEAFIPFIRIPRDKKKKVGCFGSFGWGGGSVPKLINILKAEGYEVLEPGLVIRFFPDAQALEECYRFGLKAAKWAKNHA